MKLTRKKLILAALVIGSAAYLAPRNSHSPRSLPTSLGYGYGYGYQTTQGAGPDDQFDANALASQWQALAQQAQMQALLSGGYAGQGGYQGNSPADAYMGGNFYGNSLLNTAVSSSGDSGYIALGDGSFVSW